MIKVLSDWNEVGGALTYCQMKNLPLHATPQKNWDHMQVAELMRGKPPDYRVLDMGCGDGHSVWLLHKLGFTNLLGIDLTIKTGARSRQAWGLLRSEKKRLPFRVRRGDICDTGLPAASFDFLVCISVVEHEVDLNAFARECARLLKPGGLAYISTDYWGGAADPERPTVGRPGGVIFDRAGIDSFLKLCKANGLVPFGEDSIPECGDRVVYHLGYTFTFLSVVLRRAG